MKSRLLTILFSAVAGGMASIAVWHHFHYPNCAVSAGESMPVRRGVHEPPSNVVGSVFSEQKLQAADEFTQEEIVNISVYDKVNQSVDGIEVHSADDINNLINEKKPADQVVITILRRGKQTEVNVTLGAE